MSQRTFTLSSSNQTWHHLSNLWMQVSYNASRLTIIVHSASEHLILTRQVNVTYTRSIYWKVWWWLERLGMLLNHQQSRTAGITPEFSTPTKSHHQQLPQPLLHQEEIFTRLHGTSSASLPQLIWHFHMLKITWKSFFEINMSMVTGDRTLRSDGGRKWCQRCSSSSWKTCLDLSTNKVDDHCSTLSCEYI